jgi:RNA polymerase sigma-70 factor (ECF subfamily)
MIPNDGVAHLVSRGDRPTRTDVEQRTLLDAEMAYRELAPAVSGYLRAQSIDDPDDVLGEIFVQVVRDLHRFSGSSADLRRWVFTIAHNRVVDHVRRRDRRPRTVELRPDHDVATTVDLTASISDPELIAALQELTDDQRQVVVLRFVGDLPLRDVAKIMRRRTGAVKALQARALANLTERLERSP